MADTKGKTELTEEEYEAMAPSDRAHYDIKGRLGDGISDEDSESTRVAREVAFSDDAGKDAEPDRSSVTQTRSPSTDEGKTATAKATGEDDGGNPANRKKTTSKKAGPSASTPPKESRDGGK